MIERFQPAADGSGVVCAGGNAVGVDYSGQCGAEEVVVMVGPGATGKLSGGDDKKARVQSVEAGGRTFSILTLSHTGKHPDAAAAGASVNLGRQTIRLDGTRLEFGIMAAAPELKQ